MDELTRLGIKHNTDKAYYHHFTEIYSKFFEPLKEKQLNILEIGVASGSSLLMLKEYFTNSRLYVADIDDKSEFIDERVSFIRGDQADWDFISNIFGDVKFDIIIDDGGHTMKQQQVTLEALLPRLDINGIYVLEDLHTSFSADYNDDNKSTTLDLLENIFNVETDNSNFYIKDVSNLQKIIGTCEIFYTNNGKSVTSVITRR